jgi:3-oxoacyl-[acyl-carrier protein] reductase
MALTLADHGAQLMLTATDEAALEETACRCRAAAVTVAADLDDPAGPTRVAEAVRDTFGHVDVVINNAGIGMASHWPDFWTNPVPFWSVERTRYERYLRVNFLAGLDLARLVVPSMIERGWGRIINVTTSLSTMLTAGQAPYASSKAATEAITAVQAADLVGTGVTANVVTTGGSAATRLIPEAVPRETLLPDTVLDRPVLWLASRLSDGVTARRFIGATWDRSLPLAEGAAANAALVAWTGYGAEVSGPVPPPRQPAGIAVDHTGATPPTRR